MAKCCHHGGGEPKEFGVGVTKSLQAAGANLIFTYRKERSYQKLTSLLSEAGIDPLLIVPCDVSDDASIENAFSESNKKSGQSTAWFTRLHLPTRMSCAGSMWKLPVTGT
jgi:enoyl-[acyl-carrier-protein] reductase (NADH)